MTDLQNHVNQIAAKIHNGFGDEVNSDNEPFSAYDYLENAIDIEYIVDRQKGYLGARILVAFGGPNIWVNTRTGTVEGHWWGENARASFEDNIDLDNALSDIFNS
jgi:hypothetical protein